MLLIYRLFVEAHWINVFYDNDMSGYFKHYACLLIILSRVPMVRTEPIRLILLVRRYLNQSRDRSEAH